MFECTTQLALQRQLITQLNLGISSSSSSMMFQNGIMTKDAGKGHHVFPCAFLSSCNSQE
jgi:hypothetical protein